MATGKQPNGRRERLAALDAQAAAELAGHPARGARFRREVLDKGTDDAQGARRTRERRAERPRVATDAQAFFLHCRACRAGFVSMLELLRHAERCGTTPTPRPRRTRKAPPAAA